MKITDLILEQLIENSDWDYALANRTLIKPKPAIYALISDLNIPRLTGSTRIIYIGQTKCLGGKSDRARLYSYCYPSSNHDRSIRYRIEKLIKNGHKINLYWCHVATETESKAEEKFLLNKHLDQHLELPPLNGKR